MVKKRKKQSFNVTLVMKLSTDNVANVRVVANDEEEAREKAIEMAENGDFEDADWEPLSDDMETRTFIVNEVEESDEE